MTERTKSPPIETQKTPKGKEIPIPKREDVLRDLKKVASARVTDDRKKH
jgi:hypothetical protein